jgi:hypothetical protein
MKALKEAIKRRKLDATVKQGAIPGVFRLE